jgi:hypothetical protein
MHKPTLAADVNCTEQVPRFDELQQVRCTHHALRPATHLAIPRQALEPFRPTLSAAI